MKGRISLEKYSMPLLGVGILLTLFSLSQVLMGETSHRQEAMGSYLFGYVFWVGITLGCFGFTVLYHLVRAKWVLPVLRILEAGGGVAMLAVMALLFLPILIPAAQGNPILYQWASAANRAHDLILKHKEPYLNPTGFTIRFIIYFAIWIGTAYWFKASTIKQEKNGDEGQVTKRNNAAGVAFLVYVLTITFALTDWVMSVDPKWSSTMYGLWSMVSMGIGGLTIAVMTFCFNADKEPYKKIVNSSLTRDLGNILFVLTMLWGYTSLSQYLIIWSGNLPETNFYYVERSKMSWNLVGMVAIIGQFFLPFVMLLTPRNKMTTLNLGKVALFMLLIHVVDIYQYVMPALRTTGPTPTLADGVALLGIGCLWAGLTGMLTQKFDLIPSFDNRLLQGGHGAH